MPSLTQRRLGRRARARARWGWSRSERATAALAAASVASAGTVLAGQFGRMLRPPQPTSRPTVPA